MTLANRRRSPPQRRYLLVGQPGSFIITTIAGLPIPTLSINGGLPNGVSFTDNGDGTGSISGTPALGTGGVYGLTIVTNNGGTSSQAFTLTVNQAPAIVSAPSTIFAVNQPNAFTLKTTGFPVATFTPNPASERPDADHGDGTYHQRTPTATGNFQPPSAR